MNRSLSRSTGSRQPLSRAECRNRLPRHHEGRICYLTGRGWRSAVVTYRAVEDQVLIRLPDFHDAVRYAPGQDVTFEVCEAGVEEGRLDEISIRGPASLSPVEPQLGTADAAEGPAPDLFEEPPWPGTEMRVLCVPARDISGFTEPV